jgi:hypothetical protein
MTLFFTKETCAKEIYKKVWKMRGMKKKGRGMKEGVIMKQIAIALIILVAFVAPASAGTATLTVTPSDCTSGALVEIKGEGFGATETVKLESTCTCRKPVVDGEVECCLQKFSISNENTGFSLTVSNVNQDVVIHLQRYVLGIPGIRWTIDHDMLGFDFTYDPGTHKSKVERGKTTPVGIYNIDVMGKAIAGVCDVEMKTTVTTEVTTDVAGKFTEFVDTHGIPAGTYTITATSPTASATSTSNLLLKGDVSGDGYVGAYDCVCIARWVVGIPGYTAATLNLDLYTADVNGDGVVDINDARYLARYLVGLETVLH